MAKGLKRFPEVLYADQTKMQKIRDNWKHHFKRGEPVWVLECNRLKVAGPYTFAYYSPASAVVLFPSYVGRFGHRRVQFLKDEVMYLTEQDALHHLSSLLIIKYLEMCSKCDSLLDDITKIAEPKIVETIKKVRGLL